MSRLKAQLVTVTCAVHPDRERQVTVSYFDKSATKLFFCNDECRLSYVGKVPHPARHVARLMMPCAVPGCEELCPRTERQVALNKSGRFFCSLAHQYELGVKPPTVLKVPCEICRNAVKATQGVVAFL